MPDYLPRARGYSNALRGKYRRRIMREGANMVVLGTGRGQGVAQPEIHARVFEALKRINPGELVSEGRVYGGGLHKVEPKELAHIPARGVLESIDTHVRIEQQEKLFA